MIFHYEHIHSLTHAPRDGVERGAQTRTLESETVWGIVGGGVLIEGHRTGISGRQALGRQRYVRLHRRFGNPPLAGPTEVNRRAPTARISREHDAHRIRKGKVGYKAEDIDMLVVHIPPLEIWYVLPVTVFARISRSGSIQISGSGPAVGRGIARLGDCSPASPRNSTRSWVADLPILPSCTQRNRNWMEQCLGRRDLGQF